jgi:predicted metalloendopeptidase
MRVKFFFSITVVTIAGMLATPIPRAQSPTSGLDAAGFDRTVKPGDDLYRYVNGGWMARVAMPADRVTYGAFAEIADRTESDLRAIIEQVAARPHRPNGTEAQQIADLYTSSMDEARINRLGRTAIQPELDRIAAIASIRDLAAEAGYLSAIAAGGPFDGSVGLDPASHGSPVVRVTQGGILLQPEDYLQPDAVFADIREKYEQYRDWWTPADASGFRERARRLQSQLDAYEPLPGMRVDGALTLDESLGDLCGLSIAVRAYKRSLKGRASPVIDGLSGEQRLFMGWAQIWRTKDRDEYLRQTLRNAAYLPGAYRVHAAATNIDGFYDAFGIAPGSPLYRAPADRVKIW